MRFTRGGRRGERGGVAAPLSPGAQCDVATRHVRWQHTPGYEENHFLSSFAAYPASLVSIVSFVIILVFVEARPRSATPLAITQKGIRRGRSPARLLTRAREGEVPNGEKGEEEEEAGAGEGDIEGRSISLKRRKPGRGDESEREGKGIEKSRREDTGCISN